jgi:adenine phosphoribosyltransferase
VIPYYPFHGVPRFYDISGMTHNPEIFQLAIDVFVRRYASLDVDCIAGLDARGFVLGPPIALALKKPFVMIRKKGKLPNSVSGEDYSKEYQGDNDRGADALCVSRTAIAAGKRVLVIDDLVATGGTLIAACDILKAIGATIVECACMVELKALGGYAKLQARHEGVQVRIHTLSLSLYIYIYIYVISPSLSPFPSPFRLSNTDTHTHTHTHTHTPSGVRTH